MIIIVGAAKKYGLTVGDHAISENIVPCWECRYCKHGSYNMCKCYIVGIVHTCTCVSVALYVQPYTCTSIPKLIQEAFEEAYVTLCVYFAMATPCY